MGKKVWNSQGRAADAFNKKYGMDTVDYPNGYTGNGVYRNVSMDNYGDVHARYGKNGKYGMESAYKTSRGYNGTNLSDPYSDAQLRDEFKNDTKIQDAYKKANDEVNDYHNGNYTYVKGKGWELKK